MLCDRGEDRLCLSIEDWASGETWKTMDHGKETMTTIKKAMKRSRLRERKQKRYEQGGRRRG